MRRRVLALGSAVALSVCIHIAAASLLLGPTEKGAQDFGSGGIVVSLGPAGREPGGEQTAVGKADTRNSEATATANAESANAAQRADAVPVETTEVFETSETEPLDVVNLAEASENTAVLPLESRENPEDDPVDMVISAEAVEETTVLRTDAIKPSEAPPDDVPKAIETMPATPTEPIETVQAAETLQAKPSDLAAVPTSKIVRAVIKRRPVSVDPDDQVKPTEHQTHRVSAIKPKPKAQPSPSVPRHRLRRAAAGHTDARVAEGPEPATQPTQEAVETTKAIGPPSQIANSMAGQGGQSSATGRNETGSGDDTPGGGTPGAAADYYTRLQAWLEKYKRYPRHAKLRNEQGVVLLRFVVTRAGEVTDFGIEKSSGHSLLDEEVRKMIKRAQPLPKMPTEMHETRVELLVPVQFFLR